MQEQNEETSGSEFDRMDQAHGVNETLAAEPPADEGGMFEVKLRATGTVTGGENNPDEEAFDPTTLPDMIDAAREEDAEDEKIDFSTLSEADARAVLFEGLVEQGKKITELESHLQLLGMSFIRILEEAGQIEQVEKKQPKMATVIRPR